MTNDDFTPTDAELLAYDRGLLADHLIEAVAGWLEQHPEGEERLQRLTATNPDNVNRALRSPGDVQGEFAALHQVIGSIVDRALSSPSSAAPTNLVPTAIRDYQLTVKLGQGGMGTVYRARHNRLHRDVAIKLLPIHLAADPEFRARFEREMAVIGQLDHPNLIRAHDAGVDGNHLFLVMDLLDGSDLQSVVQENGPLAVADACEAVRQAAIGLNYAHEHGIIHRDIKPGNLFLTRSGSIKVIDLGLARSADRHLTAGAVTSANMVMGTPEYMAPEQWSNVDVGPAADTYALGCVLFFLLTGRPPFIRNERQTWMEMCEAHRNHAPPNLCELRPDMPARLATLVAQMLTKLPEVRPSTSAVIDQLGQMSAGHALADALTPSNRPRLQHARGDAISSEREDDGIASRRLPARRLRNRVLAAGSALVISAALFAGWYFTRPPVMPPTPPAREPPGMPPTLPAQQLPPTTGEPTVLKATRTLSRHTGKVRVVAYSPNGKSLASAGEDKIIRLWDTETWQAREIPTTHVGEIIWLAFSPKGERIATVTYDREDCHVRLWDVATGQPAGTLGGGSAGGWGVAWSPDGTRIACGGWDKTLRVWTVATGTELFAVPSEVDRLIRGLGYSPKGDTIVTGGSGPTRLWDAKTGDAIAADLPPDLSPTFLPSGDRIAGWSYLLGRVTICDVPSGRTRTSWRAHPAEIEGLGISPDGRFVATVGKDEVRLWALEDQSQIATLLGHRGIVYSATFNPTGTHLATAGMDDSTIHIWELPAICRTRK